MADFGDVVDALDRINMIAADLNSKTDDVIDVLENINDAIEASADRDTAGGGGDASGGKKGGGGGAGAGRPGKKKAGGAGVGLESLIGLARRHPAAAAISAIAAPIGVAAGQGIVSAARGGDFVAGFESSINKTLGKVPIIGEATGLAGGARIEQATTKRIGQAVGAIEAIAGSGVVSPETEQFLLKEISGQEERRESAHERIRMRAQEFFRDNPGARGNRPRINGVDVVGMLFMGAGAPVWRKLMEGSGIGLHR